MRVKRVAVFSGFDPKVVERLRPQLEAQQTNVVVVKIGASADINYFVRLAERLLTVTAPLLATEEARYVGILVSCLTSLDEIAAEREEFFPIMRRLAVPAHFRRDVTQANTLAQDIIKLVTSEDFLATYRRLKPASDAVLALPIQNSYSSRLKGELAKIYDLSAYQPAPALDRYVQRLKRGAGLKSNGLDFRGCVNGPSHPVRRKSTSTKCDLAGRFRLGFSVPARFEFDVSCSTGLAQRALHLCDGTLVKISGSPSHLNMRMNDDFEAK